MVTIQAAEHGVAIPRALIVSILMSGAAALDAGPALAQACTRQGLDVACDDGRRGVLSGDSIIWADGTSGFRVRVCDAPRNDSDPSDTAR